MGTDTAEVQISFAQSLTLSLRVQTLGAYNNLQIILNFINITFLIK